MASYITTQDAREYASSVGLTLPESDMDVDGTLGLATLLARASTYLDRIYGARYIGSRTTGAQPLYWPRVVTSYYDSVGNYRSDFLSTEVPVELGYAATELAAKMFNDDFDVFAQPAPMVTEESKSIDSLSISRKYATPYSTNAFYSLDLILAPLLKNESAKRVTMTRGA